MILIFASRGILLCLLRLNPINIRSSILSYRHNLISEYFKQLAK